MGYGTEKQNLKNNEGIQSRAVIEEKVSNECTRGVPALELEFLQEETSKLKKKLDCFAVYVRVIVFEL